MPKSATRSTVQTTPDQNTQEDTMPKTTAKTTAKPAAAKSAKPAAEAQAKPEAPAVAKPGLLDPQAVAAAADAARKQVAEQYREQITDALAHGWSVKQIAASMGTSRVGVRKVMMLLDLKPAGGSGGSGANAERDQQIAKMTAAGATPAQVAERFGLSVGRSRRIMQKHGYTRTIRTYAARFESHEQAEAAVAAYQELAAYGGGSVKAAVRAVEAFLADEQGYQYATDADSASEAESTVSEPVEPDADREPSDSDFGYTPGEDSE